MLIRQSILVGFLLFCSLVIHAQNKYQWRFGIEMGLNYSNSSEDTHPLKKEWPILPKFGVTADWELSSKMLIHSGVFYNFKGLKSSGNTESLNANVKLNQQVIQLPVTVRFQIPLKSFLIGIEGGGYYSYGIAGKTKANGTVNGTEIDIEKNTFNEILNRNDCGLIFGLYTRLNHMCLNLVYEYGLVDVGKSNVLGSALNYKNRIIALSLNYSF